MTNRQPFVPPPLHELEAEVMQDLWTAGESNVRAVLERLNAKGGKERAYTTVMTIMSRLDRKGMLSRRRDGKTDYYRAVMNQETYLEARAQTEVGALVDEFGEVALVHFARQMDKLDPKRLAELRRLAGDA